MILFGTIFFILLLILCIFVLNKSNSKFKTCIENMAFDGRKDALNKNANAMEKNKNTPILNNLGINPKTSDWITMNFDDKMKYGNKEKILESFDNPTFTKKTVDTPAPDIIKNMKTCKLMNTSKNCGNIETNKDICGYCVQTDTFMYHDKNNPNGLLIEGKKISSCPGKLDTTPATCEIKKCGEINTCSEISIKKMQNACGYCPGTNKIVPLKQPDGKKKSKYNYGDTKCNVELVTGGDCGDYQDDPCFSDFRSSGPQPLKCVEKSWKEHGCTHNNGATEFVDKKMSIKDMFAGMTNIVDKLSSDNYGLAKYAHNKCHGNLDKLNSCDPKYKDADGNYPKECYQQKLLGTNKEGFTSSEMSKKAYLSLCSKNAKGYQTLTDNLENHQKLLNDIEGRNINMSNLTEYTNYIKTIKNYTHGKNIEKTGRSFLEEKAIKKRAVDFCTGGKIQDILPLKVGDKVKMKSNNFYLVGYIFKDYGDEVDVLWTEKWDKNNKVLKKTDGSDDTRDQAIIMDKLSKENKKTYEKKWGWPGPKYPSEFSKNFNGILMGPRYNKTNLKLLKKCDAGGLSSCVPSCNRTIETLKDRYPEPKDCVYSKWSDYGACDKPCGGGAQNSTRKILYPAKRGGKPCPKTLIRTRGCNTQVCSNPNFTNVYGR
jgi:hypothetical protein